MSQSTTWLRRLASRLLRHAMWVLPGERSTWADAMRNELHHLDEDREAFRWAMGCVVAGYRERLIPTGSDKQWARWQVTRSVGRSRFVFRFGLYWSCFMFFYYFIISFFFGYPGLFAVAAKYASPYMWVLITVPPILFNLLIGCLVGVSIWSTTERGYERWQRENRKS